MWLQEQVEGPQGPRAGSRLDEEEETTTEGVIVCRSCGAAITRREHRVARGGGHRHTQMNPHGYFFRLLCFADASGARARGAPSARWSWFDGFAWLIAECRGCGTHLGWRFVPTAPGNGQPFYGLIEDRLREVE